MTIRLIVIRDERAPARRSTPQATDWWQYLHLPSHAAAARASGGERA